jgi:hypothetical protein
VPAGRFNAPRDAGYNHDLPLGETPLVEDFTMLRLAILGPGWAGTRHVEVIRELGRKAVVDCIVLRPGDRGLCRLRRQCLRRADDGPERPAEPCHRPANDVS